MLNFSHVIAGYVCESIIYLVWNLVTLDKLIQMLTTIYDEFVGYVYACDQNQDPRCSFALLSFISFSHVALTRA